jgi:nucleotide-binding universal stress UspA family protein
MSRFHNILVAVDFSQTADDALGVAAEMSRIYRARVHVVHVVSNPFNVPYGTEPLAYDFSAFLRQSVESATTELDAIAARHVIDPALLTKQVVSGPPAAEIVRYAEEHAIDLIVLGAHGHGFFDRLLIGSVAERVSRHAPCAVVMVPHVTRRRAPVEVKAAAAVAS